VNLEEVDFGDNFQHGFRGNHGTVTACLEIQSHVATAMDNKMFVLMYSADMSAAFDLLRKENLILPQIPNELAAVVQNFLSERKAFVQIGEETSMVFKLPAGVPQGSVLGPKLFSIYTKGLEKIKRDGVEVVAYADDSYVICSARSKAELVSLANTTINEHLDWLKQVGMVVNPDKTELVFFTKQENERIELTYNDLKLVSADSMNVLGITFDHALTWNHQLKCAIQKCQRLKPALQMLSKKLSRREFLQVTTAHYFSNLYYCSEVWYPPLSCKLKKSINLIHYFPLRLSVKDFARKLSYKKLDKLSRRASPFDLNEFKVARCLINFSNNSAPFSLFQDLLVNAVVESRNPTRPWFLDTSRTRIGHQSFCNRVTNISKRLKFEWYGRPRTKEDIRANLKRTFFPYLA